jgi:hypothetical protein
MRFTEFSKPFVTHLYCGGPLSSGVSLPNSLCESKEGKNTHLE